MVKNKALTESAYISELAIHGIQEKKRKRHYQVRPS